MIDLNLLRVADALYRHGNLSRAGRELGVSQSAMSHALSRLRAHYGDPLFIRVSRGVEPTRFCRSLAEEIAALVAGADAVSRRREAFEPALAEGRVVIATTEYVEIVAGAKLIASLRKEAPKLVVSFRPLAGALPKAELDSGSSDLAIAGYFKDLPPGLYEQKLFEDRFSVAVRRGHPLCKGRLTAERYFEAEHALITIEGDFRDPLRREVNGRMLARRIVYGSASFAALAWVLGASDLVLTAPTRLLEAYAKHFPITLMPCPIETRLLAMRMVWHARTHSDPLRRWLRQRIASACSP